jgi:hypothetical protein
MNFADETTEALEARLKKLRPVPVPPELMARLRAAAPAARVPPQRAVRFPLAWAAAAAAAAVLASVRLLDREPAGPSPAAPAKALAELAAESSREILVGARQAGTWTAPDGQMYRVVQCLSMNRTVLREPEKGAQVDVLEPRPRVLLLAMGSQ